MSTPKKANSHLLACALLASALLALALPGITQAGTSISLFTSFAGNINFVTTGNTLRANSNGVDPCSLISGNQGAAVDAGTDNGTISGIPGGSSIVAAYLYYAGSSTTVDSTVTFNGNSVTASRTFTDSTVVPWFGGFVDVTSLVTGNGTYTFGGLTVNNQNGGTYCNGSQTMLAGWALVVIYSNNSESNRVINVYDGFQLFQNSSITLNPTNFQVPNSGINGKFAVITWEGDPTLSGNETLQFNSNTLTDSCNGAANQYNSTINTLICTGNATTDDVYYGVDLDTFDASSYLTAGETSATTFYQSGPDAVILNAQIISISNTPVADLSITKSNASAFVAGSNGVYTLTVHNNGPSTATGTTTVTDTLPTGETFVSGTGTGWSCSAVGQAVTCTSTGSIASGTDANAISLTVAVANGAANSISNTASVSNNTMFDNVSGNNSSTDVTTVLYSSDVQITKTHSGNFTAGTPGSYTLTVKNNGPNAANGTTTVTDTLPAGETFVSASGTGWSCGAVGQAVTCTSSTAIAGGATLPVITLNVSLSASAGSPLSNTATVSNSLVSETNNANNSSTDPTTVTSPNYSTSTKTVTDLTQSPTQSGDTLQYTITIKDTAGQAGTNIEVTDTLDVDLGTPSFTTLPPGSTNNSSGSNIDITGISIPANGSVTIVYTTVITGSPGDIINNTATIIGGTVSAAPQAAPVSVTGATTGNKILYFLTAGITATSGSFHRVQGTASTTAKNDNIATNGGSVTWTLQFKTAKTTVITGNATADLYIARGSGQNRAGARSLQVTLTAGANSISGTNTTCSPGSTTTPTLCSFALGGTPLTVPAGTQLTMTLANNTTVDNRRTIAFFPEHDTGRQSELSFDLTPAINVDSINFYNAAYPSTSTQSVFEPNQTVYVRAVVSDPFGCFDMGYSAGPPPANDSVDLTLTDPTSTVQVNGANLVTNNKTTCSTPTAPNAYAPTMTYEYPYALGSGAATGYWQAQVISREGLEQTVTNTGGSTFLVGLPSLLIVKSASILYDAVNCTTTGTFPAITITCPTNPRAIPGAISKYNIVVSNTGNGGANGVYVIDAIPTNTSFVVGSMSFTDGSTSSGLSTPTYSYDNVSCSGSFTYTPTGTGSPFPTDPNVKCVKAKFTAATNMNGQTGATAPSFTVSFETKVN